MTEKMVHQKMESIYEQTLVFIQICDQTIAELKAQKLRRFRAIQNEVIKEIKKNTSLSDEDAATLAASKVMTHNSTLWN